MLINILKIHRITYIYRFNVVIFYGRFDTVVNSPSKVCVQHSLEGEELCLLFFGEEFEVCVVSKVNGL